MKFNCMWMLEVIEITCTVLVFAIWPFSIEIWYPVGDHLLGFVDHL